jgi:septal ring factor EnvC (AmiA/AmiB activator)
MSGIFESIRSQVEDVLFQWNRKEEEYLNIIQELKDENIQLNVSLADLKQELEFLAKQFDGSQSNEKKLILEIEKLKLDNAILDTSRANKKRWRFIL